MRGQHFVRIRIVFNLVTSDLVSSVPSRNLLLSQYYLYHDKIYCFINHIVNNNIIITCSSSRYP